MRRRDAAGDDGIDSDSGFGDLNRQGFSKGHERAAQTVGNTRFGIGAMMPDDAMIRIRPHFFSTIDVNAARM
jgi:hypothetical protein